MRKFSLIMEPALPRTDSDLLHFVKEQMDRTPVDKGLLNSILDGFPYCILVFNENGEIAYVNKQFCQFVGSTAKELIGMDIKEFADTYVHTKPYDFTRLPRILCGETITGYKYEMIKADGSLGTVEFNSYPIRHDHDKKEKTGCLVLIKVKEDE